LLDSAVHRPFTLFGNVPLYTTGLDQAGALLQSLAQNHAFEDGNKRTAIVSCLYFLDRCGYWKNIAFLTQYEAEMLEELTLMVATERLQRTGGTLSGPLEATDIGKALHDILGPSRNRKLRPARRLSGLFRHIQEIITPKD
jgi:Fic/DOC family protein